ncbi:MAG: GAF domain-containing protein [Calditrichaeota bacterium]|nr:MAG: GAF domain-containing protein [Calditrichota bacterium]
MFSKQAIHQDVEDASAARSKRVSQSEKLAALIEEYAAEISRLKAENERLRAAVESEQAVRGDLSLFMDQFLTIQRASNLITQHLSYPKIARALLDLCRRIIPDANGDLYLFQHDGWSAALNAPEFPYYPLVEHMHAEGIVDWLWENDNTIVVPVDDFAFPVINPPNEGCFICAPLVSNGHRLGILLIYSRQDQKDFSLEKLELLNLLVKQSSVAIQYTRLYKQLEQTHQELKNSQKNLVQAIRMATVGEISGGIAHEINNPLQIILGKIQISLMKDPNNETLRMVETQAMRIAAIVRGLMTLARQKDVQSRQYVPVASVLEQTLELVRGQIEKRGVKVGIKVEPNLPLVHVNTVQLQQVILHFLLNAKRQLVHGGQLTVHVGMQKPGWVSIEIKDTGVPIEAEVLQGALEPFTGTGNQSCSENHLGLTVSVQMIREMGGEVEMESASGKGNRIVIYLPPYNAEEPSNGNGGLLETAAG